MEPNPVVVERAAPAGPLESLTAELEQLDGFPEVLASLAAGHSGTLGGVWGSSCALAAAALAQRCPATLLVVAPRPMMVDTLADDLALFTKTPVTRFRPSETTPSRQVVVDEIEGERLRATKHLAHRPADTHLVVTSIQALMQPVPSREVLAESTRILSVGHQLDLEELAAWLTGRGCHGTSAVELPGEFALRGGIVDLFPPDAVAPVRIELFGDEIESIREFDVATQRSLASLEQVPVTLLDPQSPPRAHLTSYIPEGSWFVLVEPADIEEEGRYFHERQESPDRLHSTRTTLTEIYKFPSVTAAGIPQGSYETTCHLDFESVERFSGDLQKVRDELEAVAGDERVMLVCETPAEVERLEELFSKSPLLTGGRLEFVTGRLAEGFRIVPRKTVLLLFRASCFTATPTLARTSRQLSIAGDRQLPGAARRATWSSTSPTASAAIAGMKLLEKERPGRRAPGARVPRRHEALRAQLEDRPGAEVRRRQEAGPRWPSSAARRWVRQKQAAEQAVHRPGRRDARAAGRRAPRGPGIALPRRHRLAARVRRLVPLPGDARPAARPSTAIKRDMQASAADGPAALRRRRLRQDRAGHAGGVQGGRRRLPGGRAGADDRAGRAAPPHVHRADGRVPLRDRRALPLLHGASEQREIIERLAARARSTS